MKIRKNGKVVTLTESDLRRIVKRVISEQEGEFDFKPVKINDLAMGNHIADVKIGSGRDYADMTLRVEKKKKQGSELRSDTDTYYAKIDIKGAPSAPTATLTQAFTCGGGNINIGDGFKPQFNVSPKITGKYMIHSTKLSGKPEMSLGKFVSAMGKPVNLNQYSEVVEFCKKQS